MAAQEYQHGQMDISAQKAAWNGFLNFSMWGGMITLLIVGYATLALAIGMNWMVSLALMAIVGFAAGAFMKMGGRWVAAMVMMIVLAFIVQAMIWLFGSVM